MRFVLSKLFGSPSYMIGAPAEPAVSHLGLPEHPSEFPGTNLPALLPALDAGGFGRCGRLSVSGEKNDAHLSVHHFYERTYFLSSL